MPNLQEGVDLIIAPIPPCGESNCNVLSYCRPCPQKSYDENFDTALCFGRKIQEYAALQPAKPNVEFSGERYSLIFISEKMGLTPAAIPSVVNLKQAYEERQEKYKLYPNSLLMFKQKIIEFDTNLYEERNI